MIFFAVFDLSTLTLRVHYV